MVRQNTKKEGIGLTGMSSFYILIALLIIPAIVTFSYTKDIGNPGVVLSLSFLFASFSATVGYGRWHNNTLSPLTILVLCVGVYTFCIISIIISLSLHRTQTNHQEDAHVLWALNPTISLWKLAIVTVFILLISFIYLKQLISLMNSMGYTGYSVAEKLNAYRGTVLLTNDEGNTGGISLIVQQLRNIIDVLVPLLFFEFFRERLFLGKTNIAVLLALLAGLTSSFLSTGRALLLSYLLGGIIIYFYLARVKKKKFDTRVIVKVISCGAFLLCLLFILNSVLARNVNLGFVDYISFYFGSSITNLNTFLSGPITWPGQTLNGLAKIAHTLGFANTYSEIPNVWVHYRGGISSNVYTGVQRYYADAGLLGVLLGMSIFSIVITIFYFKARDEGQPLWCVFYAMCFSTLIDQSRSESFFTYFLRISLPLTIICLILLFRFINQHAPTRYLTAADPRYKLN